MKSPETLLVGVGDLGSNLARKMSTIYGIDVRVFRGVKETNRSKIISFNSDFFLLEKYDLLFILCGLGGETGTTFTPLIARAARNFATIVCTAVVPFRAERERYRVAKRALKGFRKSCDTLILVENDWLCRNYPKTFLSDALEFLNGIIIKTLGAMIGSIKSSEFDSEDFIRLLKSSWTCAMLFGTGKTCKKAISNCISNPLFGYDISAANSLFLHVESEDEREARSAVSQLNCEFRVFMSFRKNYGNRVYGVAFGIDPEIEVPED